MDWAYITQHKDQKYSKGEITEGFTAKHWIIAI